MVPLIPLQIEKQQIVQDWCEQQATDSPLPKGWKQVVGAPSGASLQQPLTISRQVGAI
jgi:hypothetical protein